MSRRVAGWAIRGSLAARTALVTLFVVLSFILPLGFMFKNQARDQAVDSAELLARSIASVYQTDASRQVLSSLVEQANSRPSRRTVDVVLPDQSVLGPSLPGPTSLPGTNGDRASTLGGPDRSVLVILPVTDSGLGVVRVLVPSTVIGKGVVRDWTLLVAAGVVLVSLSVLISDRLGRSIVRPIRELESVASRLSAGDLVVQAEQQGPREVRSVAVALNRLSERISELLAAEREAAADLSHRLRTPLTALRLHAERLADPAERELLAGDMRTLTAEVDAVIREARSTSHDRGPCPVVEVVATRLRFWKILAQKQGRSLHISLPDHDALIELAPGDLQAAIDAIVANVFAHTPEETPFSVIVTIHSETCSVRIKDRGPGIRPEFATRGRSGGDGTGLGLDIARRTVEQARGALSIDVRPGGGSVVTMSFPIVQAAAGLRTLDERESVMFRMSAPEPGCALTAGETLPPGQRAR